MKHKVVSLFSGCGGMDLGIEGNFTFLRQHYDRTNFHVIQAIDFDRRVVEIYNQNLPTKCKVMDILNTPNEYFQDHDVLIGGFPCQSFSVVAQNPKRLGYKDDKGKLFFEICRLLRHHQPKAFIAENVKGILSANKGEAFALIINEFKNCGYHVKFQLLNSANYGVPQKRERVFIVGFKEKKHFLNFDFPAPIINDKKNHVPISRILEKNSSVLEPYFFSEKAVRGMLRTKNYKSMNKGRAQDINKPCNTVGSHLAKVSLNSTDPVLLVADKYRMFTPREVARIQSFPENFKLADSKTWNYIALGNAVPPVLMWHVSQKLDEALT